MADITLNTPAGQTISRDKMVLYLNTSSSSTPTWSPVGARVEDSSMELDWDDSSTRDILGNVRNSMREPVITQTFDPAKLDSADSAYVKIWNLAVKDHDAQALCNLDMLLVHYYAGTAATPFAERYSGCMVKPTGLGGEGGGDLNMPFEVTFGGTRTTGTASKNASTGVVTFTVAS